MRAMAWLGASILVFIVTVLLTGASALALKSVPIAAATAAAMSRGLLLLAVAVVIELTENHEAPARCARNSTSFLSFTLTSDGRCARGDRAR